MKKLLLLLPAICLGLQAAESTTQAINSFSVGDAWGAATSAVKTGFQATSDVAQATWSGLATFYTHILVPGTVHTVRGAKETISATVDALGVSKDILGVAGQKGYAFAERHPQVSLAVAIGIEGHV